MSVIIRERERERDRERDRDWDERSSTYRDAARGTITTVKRYRVPPPDDDPKIERLSLYERDRDRDRRSDYEHDSGSSVKETRIIRRERSPEPEPERRVERDIRIERIEREREPEPERRYEKDIRIERYEREREPEPRRFEREYRYERDIDTIPVRRDPYELERYSKSTEYFRNPDPPQPIIIRQAPQQIIIQEAPRAPIVIAAPPKEESDYQLIQRSEVVEDRQVARREPQREEDYYYERRTREVSGGDRDSDDVYEERYNRRRDVSPGDSISQRDRDYSSDDSMVYIRKETRETYGRDDSPHHKRRLAEGAIAGLGAAELIRYHRKEEGKDSSSRGSRVGKDIGAAALGAVAAEGISRARSHHREKSRIRNGSRSRSRERDRKSRRKHRHGRSRSRSHSRIRQLAGLGLGAAALAAAVGYANRNKNNNKEDRRSRSRTRRHSASAVPEDDARNPSHRKKKIAQAGLASAAVASLVERARSRSRGGRGKSRSKSRVRQGLEVGAAGLGGAALAGIYEKNQAKKAEKEDEAVRRDARTKRRVARSRSRSVPYDGLRDASASDPGLIEYGDQPVYSGGGVPDFYNRPASQVGLYGAPNEAVPALTSGPAKNESRSRDRRREISSSESDSGRRRRHRRKKDGSRSQSRTRDLATAGLAAGATGLAASQHEKRKQRKKEEKRERRRQEAEQESGRGDYTPQAQYPAASTTPPGALPTGDPHNYYPSTNLFPPPPNPGYLPSPNYNAADYPAQPGQQPASQVHPDYGYPPASGYASPLGGQYEPQPQNPYAPGENRTRRADENVSAEPFVNSTVPGAPHVSKHVAEEGLKRQRVPTSTSSQPRASSQPPPVTKSVQFDLGPHDSSSGSSTSGPNSPDQIRKPRRRPTGSTNHRSNANSNQNRISTPAPTDNSRLRPSKSRISRSPSPAPSDVTLDLPERFDKYGRPVPERGEDSLADVVEDLITGTGIAGKFLGKLAVGFGGNKGGSRSRK